MDHQLAAIKQSIEHERQHVINRYSDGQLRPEALLSDLCVVIDRAFKRLIPHTPLPEGTALCAVGGYGRGELYPYSDIDILVLIPAEPNIEEKSQLEAFVQTLWDIGLEVGASVRTINDCLEESKKDITIETTLLETRFLLGNRQLVQELETEFRKIHNPKNFFLAKRIEMNQRYARYNETPYALEPNCKESPGTLRDIQLIQWLARSSNLGNHWKDLVNADLMTEKKPRK